MENASKALIMAGSVLIALLIIGALLLMFNNLSSYQETDTQSTKEAQVIEFNNQYETYNRKNVRGSELYSLMNRVVDYNKRKSTKGTGKNEGQYLAYAPMTISYNLEGKQDKLRFDSQNRIFVDNYINFTLNEASIENFENYINTKIRKIKKLAVNEVAMQNLASGVSNLFNKTNEKDKLQAIKLWNDNVISTKRTNNQQDTNIQYNGINTENNKEKIYTYYEFMQFKRAKFDCKNVEYDQQTGRIIKMEFEFTGKIE